MKHVVSTNQVAHLWANKLQGDARNGGYNNFYFEGDTIYSYGRHFPIAKHVVNEQGENGVLFTERTYSNTTAKHIRMARWAADHLNLIYCDSPDSTPDENFYHWHEEGLQVLQKLIKAKKPELYLPKLAEIKARAEKYAAFFSIPVPQDLKELVETGETAQYKEYMAALDKKLEAQRQQRESEYLAQHKENLDKWLSGEYRHMSTRGTQDYLRVSRGLIETTQGVEVPMPYAQRLWANLDSLQVGDKVLNYEITETGDIIKIGCHTFPKAYLKEFGQKIFSNGK